MEKTQISEEIKVAEFTLGNEIYGIDVMRIKEIIPYLQITKVPQTPDFIEGIINLRGVVIPIVDMFKRFGLPPAQTTKETRIIVIEVGDKLIGLIVDSVSEILTLSKDVLEPAPEMLRTSIKKDYIKDIAKLDSKLIIIIDIDLIFSKEELNQI